MSKNYTVEFATTEGFEFANRAGFTTAEVRDSNIKRMHAALVQAVESGQIKPVDASDDDGDYTAIPCFLRVRRSDSANVTAPTIPGVELGVHDDLIS